MTAVDVMEPQVVEEAVEELEVEQPEPAEVEALVVEEEAVQDEAPLEDSPPSGVDPYVWRNAVRLARLGITLEYLTRRKRWTEVCHVDAELWLGDVRFMVSKCDRKQATLDTRASDKWVDEVRVGGRYEVEGHWFMITSMNYDPEGKKNVITIVTSIAPPQERQGQFQLALDEAEEEDEPIAPEILRDLLLLVARDVPLADIEQWSDEQREEVADWAAAYHVAANDNDDVVVPEMPAVLVEAEAKQRAAEALAFELGLTTDDVDSSRVYAALVERGYRWEPEAGGWTLAEQQADPSPEMEMAAMQEGAE